MSGRKVINSLSDNSANDLRPCFSAGLRIKENKEVYEGEVIELTPEETENQMGGYGKVISHVIIGLKSVKGTKQLKLDPTIFDSLQKEKVQVSPFCRDNIRTSNSIIFKSVCLLPDAMDEDASACLLTAF